MAQHWCPGVTSREVDDNWTSLTLAVHSPESDSRAIYAPISKDIFGVDEDVVHIQQHPVPIEIHMSPEWIL